jgi:hypothetical protein
MNDNLRNITIVGIDPSVGIRGTRCTLNWALCRQRVTSRLQEFANLAASGFDKTSDFGLDMLPGKMNGCATVPVIRFGAIARWPSECAFSLS